MSQYVKKYNDQIDYFVPVSHSQCSANEERIEDEKVSGAGLHQEMTSDQSLHDLGLSNQDQEEEWINVDDEFLESFKLDDQGLLVYPSKSIVSNDDWLNDLSFFEEREFTNESLAYKIDFSPTWNSRQGTSLCTLFKL